MVAEANSNVEQSKMAESSDSTLHSDSNSPSKISTITTSEDTIEISTRAYVKMVLHVSKYPHALVNGKVQILCHKWQNLIFIR